MSPCIPALTYFRNYFLLYAPDNEETQQIMRPFNLIFNRTIGFTDNGSISATDQMLSYYELYTKNMIFAGIDFSDGNISAGNVSLTIR